MVTDFLKLLFWGGVCAVLALLAIVACEKSDKPDAPALVEAIAPPPRKPEPPALEPPPESIEEQVLRSLTISARWQKGGFGAIALADIEITNDSQWDAQDFRVVMSQGGESGTRIGRTERTIYTVVEAETKRTFREVNFGFISSQVAGASFRIVGCVPGVKRYEEPRGVREARQGLVLQQLRAERLQASWESGLERKQQTELRLVSWQLEQATNGAAHARCSVGLRYLAGDGVPTNRALGLAWLQKSAAQGNAQAAMALQKETHSGQLSESGPPKPH